MLKVVTLVGTRPEIIRLSRIIVKLDQFFEHYLVHTGQNYDYELNEIFFDDLNLRRPDLYLNCAGQSPAETIGAVISSFDAFLEQARPDAVLILGDTNSALGAIAAKRRKVPIFHMEAGNRCFDQRVPEEINRKIIDHISDINLPYTSIARDYLLSEGIRPDSIIKTGSPMYEVLRFYKARIAESNILSDLGLKEQKYFVVSAHREENVNSPRKLKNLAVVLNTIAEKYQKPLIFSAHPRTRKAISENGLNFHPRVRLMKPLAFTSYVSLQMNAFVVLSDSGTITEESSILNFRALNIREAHERPEGFEEGAVMLTGLNPERVMQALDLVKHQAVLGSRDLQIVADYEAPNVSEIVARVIMSYPDFVNRNTWRKDV